MALSRFISRSALGRSRIWRGAFLFVFTILTIEFLDELIFGAGEASWPVIRDELNLDYVQIGLLLGVPNLLAVIIEPLIGLLADTGAKRRRALLLVGGACVALSLGLTASSNGFWPLMLSFVLFAPAGGAFVNLAQVILMDAAPARHEQNMARWTFAGSLGVVCGTLIVGAIGWRTFFGLACILTLLLLVLTYVTMRPSVATPAENGAEPKAADTNDVVPDAPRTLVQSLRAALAALRRREVWRWLILLDFSDFMLDILLSYLALYFVDVVRVDAGTAALAVAVWTGVGLVGDLLIIPLLERVQGLDYLRYSVLIELVLYPAFLIVPGPVPKMFILALLGFFNAGWYSVLQGQVYTALPGQGSIAMTINSIFGILGTIFPAVVGLAADMFGLGAAMWILLLGPLALLVGLPRRKAQTEAANDVQAHPSGG